MANADCYEDCEDSFVYCTMAAESTEDGCLDEAYNGQYESFANTNASYRGTHLLRSGECLLGLDRNNRLGVFAWVYDAGESSCMRAAESVLSY
jgi:hypothetical protein